MGGYRASTTFPNPKTEISAPARAAASIASPLFPFAAAYPRTAESAPIIVVNIEQSRQTVYSAYTVLEPSASDISGISDAGANGSAPHISARSAAISTEPTALAASICFTLIPRCVTSTPAPSSRFIETYTKLIGSSIKRGGAERSAPACRHTAASAATIHGTIATFACASPRDPLLTTYIPIRHSAIP